MKYYCIACIIQFVFAFLCLCYQKFGQEYRPLAESPLEKVPHLPHLFSMLVSTTFEILAAERLRLMGFDNELIIG